jgi:hypothetical protein
VEQKTAGMTDYSPADAGFTFSSLICGSGFQPRKGRIHLIIDCFMMH